jgi:hypothetical protein
MRGLLSVFSLKGLIIAAALVLVALALDSGSVVITKMSSHDDVRDAGYKAASVAKQGPTTRQTAVVALTAAQREAEAHGITVKSKGFEIFPDGRVTLTGTKTAPTLLMDHVSFLGRLTHVSTTLTVSPLPYD